jgi:prepilin signal peptidase PulO-like enzyme (type II secretory pathway)
MADLIFPILVGWALGYMVNYLSDTLPVTRRLGQPTCPNCSHEIGLTDFLLGHRCRQCGRPRLLRVWSVLLGLAAMSGYLWLNPPHNLGFLLGMALITYFAVVFVIDMEHRLILHPTSLVGAGLAFIAGWLAHGIARSVLGGVAGFVFMVILYYFGVLFAKYRANRMRASGSAPDDEEVLGAGDVILAGILGLALGWPLIWFGILLGILLGGVYGIMLVLAMALTKNIKGRALSIFMPYGPFFILSATFIIFFPRHIQNMLPG